MYFPEVATSLGNGSPACNFGHTIISGTAMEKVSAGPAPGVVRG